MDLMPGEKKIPRETMAELEAAKIAQGKPLLIVDCDEVIVEFAGHLGRWLPKLGYELRLEKYELEGAIFPEGEAHPVGFEAAINLINAFFEEETAHQAPIEGAVETLTRMAEAVQVVLLTNIPRHGRADRLINMQTIGLGALPVVVNTGGKGRAIAWASAKAGATTVFVDDSPFQIASAARHAEHVGRLHFRGATGLGNVLPKAPEADAEPESWAACEEMLRQRFRL
ncbi:MAG: hypothetical protein AAFP17_01290 [Pseudomonadota bacterium]